ncbi:MAG: FAD-binding oxidoreductase [Actinomycetia bacterium]|nr:FAD-binding oxidoreductase [Actinomycetes bacterium]
MIWNILAGAFMEEVPVMNKIELKDIEPEKCFVVEGESKILESYAAYLTDESRVECQAVSAIYFPENTAQVVDAVQRTRDRGERIVVSASRTGVAGGAAGVEDASIISLERMTARLGDWHFQAGVKLEDMQSTQSEYYPVDPTEMTASLGGTVATDASGARTYHYGSTRDFIEALTIVLADGRVLKIRRGDTVCEDGEFVLRHGYEEIIVPVVGVRMPRVRNTAGLYLKEDMDLVDLFVGSEGTLGIITEVETGAARLPEDRLFLIVYAGTEDQALGLVEAVKADVRLNCLAIEYLGPNAVALLRDNETFPNLPGDVGCAVYLEILMENEDVEVAIDEALISCGLNVDGTWAGLGEKDLHEMKRFRHMVPETVNAIIGRRKKDIHGLHKIGTDTAVPEGRLREFISFARSAIEKEGLEYVVFGHIGDNHLHINMLPRSLEELEKAEGLHHRVAEESVRLGGTVSAEHGVGRLKKHLLEIQFSEDELKAMKAVKKALDPEGVLNPGVIF